MTRSIRNFQASLGSAALPGGVTLRTALHLNSDFPMSKLTTASPSLTRIPKPDVNPDLLFCVFFLLLVDRNS